MQAKPALSRSVRQLDRRYAGSTNKVKCGPRAGSTDAAVCPRGRGTSNALHLWLSLGFEMLLQPPSPVPLSGSRRLHAKGDSQGPLVLEGISFVYFFGQAKKWTLGLGAGRPRKHMPAGAARKTNIIIKNYFNKNINFLGGQNVIFR